MAVGRVVRGQPWVDTDASAAYRLARYLIAAVDIDPALSGGVPGSRAYA
jgi:hypothetical protein